MAQEHLSNLARRRFSRRQVFISGGAVAASAAFLAACGGSESKPKQAEDASTLVYTPKDTTKSAKKGGSLSIRRSADVNALRPERAAR